MLKDREDKILNLIVEYYIKKGEPVGSSFIASHYSEDGKFLSSATIRNIFKQMENKGLIEKTHHSSGRIPTKKGLKKYLDNLAEEFRTGNINLDFDLQTKLSFSATNDLMTDLETYVEILERETSAVALLILPDLFSTKIKRIDFLKLSDRKILAVIVSVNNLFKESIIEMPHPVSYQDLITASNYINLNFSGMTLFEIKKKLLNSIEDGLAQLNNVAKRVVKLAYENIDKIYQDEDSIIIKGLHNVLDEKYVKEIKVLKSLIENFEKKKNLYRLILNYINKELAVDLDIPAENFSFIISTYSVAGGAKGAFGLVGPIRMDYRKNITIMKKISYSMIEQMFIK